MKLRPLFLLGLLTGCAQLRFVDQPTAIASMRATTDAPVMASATIISRDGKPAWARLYVIPAAHADEAQRDIAAAAGRLGRWAMVPLVSLSMEGTEQAAIALSAAARTGDLMVLAIDPVSPGRFAVTGASIMHQSTGGAE